MTADNVQYHIKIFKEHPKNKQSSSFNIYNIF
jgi:hypothetical protein